MKKTMPQTEVSKKGNTLNKIIFSGHYIVSDYNLVCYLFLIWWPGGAKGEVINIQS